MTPAFLSPLPPSLRKTSSLNHTPRERTPRPHIPRACTAKVSPLPPNASSIVCPLAQQMLSQLRFTAIQTPLSPNPINTCHVSPTESIGKDGKGGVAARVHIIFLHGFDSNLLEFRYLPAHFAGERVNVHYVDVLGWGLTDYPTDFEYTPSAKRAHVHAFVQKLIPRDAHVYLAGASLGGAVAIDYVLQHPDFVKGLILIDAQAYMDRPKSFMSALPFVAELGSEVLRSTWLRKQGINMSYQSKGLRESDDVLRIGSLHCRQPGWKEATASFVRNEGYILSQRVKEIQIPTIVLWGEYDRVLPIAHAERFQRDLRDGRLVWVRDSGHSPHIEQGEIVAGEIIEFVTEVERRTMDTGVQQRLHETQSLPKH